jgi:hypothetical protein
MKTRLLGFVALVIGLAFPIFAQQPKTNTPPSASRETKKEINFSGTNYYSATPKVFRLDPDRLLLQMDIFGVRVNDSNDGPFNGASVFIAVLQYENKGPVDPVRSRNYCVWTDKDGDKVIWELTGDPSGAPGGTAQLIDGTGKYTGWQGTLQYTLQFPKPFPEGTVRGICREVARILVPAEIK